MEVLLPSCKGFKGHSAMFAICVMGNYGDSYGEAGEEGKGV